ncbi:hypothetical protein ABVT39_026592 [Epinephelus coioides]
MASLMQNEFNTRETQTALTLSTLYQVQAQAAVRHLTAECSQIIRHTPPETQTEQQPSTSAQPAPANVGNPSSTDINLWETLDRDASEARRGRNATADATVEVQRYMTIHHWKDQKTHWITG